MPRKPAVNSPIEQGGTHLDDLLALGRSRGSLSLAEVRKAFEEAGITPAQGRSLIKELADHGVSALGGLAEVKALEARLHLVVDEFHQHDIAVKGIAPVLLDFPGERDGRAVLWCWLEGDTDIRWYHRVECGFAGRRPV